MVLASLPPIVTIPQVVQKSVQREFPQTLILRSVPREKVLNSKDAVIRPIVINKTMNLLQSNAVQMLQKVPPTAQQITTQQPLANCQTAFNQQTPPVQPVIQRIGNNTAQKLGKVSSAPRQNFLNPKEATLPFSWFVFYLYLFSYIKNNFFKTSFFFPSSIIPSSFSGFGKKEV